MKKTLMTSLALALIFFLWLGSWSQNEASLTDPDAKKWILLVDKKFNPQELDFLGASCDWYWEEAGIAVASSFDKTFGDNAAKFGKSYKIKEVFPDLKAEIVRLPEAEMEGSSIASVAQMVDGYTSNYQWYLQAIGATRPVNGGPVWQLGDYEGSGVKIGIADTGAPWDWINWDIHPEFDEFDPLHPENGGVVYERDPGTGEVVNYDDYSHGTAVASLLGAKHRGEGAMRGLVPKATLYCYKIDTNNFVSTALLGWWRAAQDEVHILNNSWGSYWLPWEKGLPKVFHAAANVLYNRGVLVFVSAANNNLNHNHDFRTVFGFPGAAAVYMIPQNLPHVIIVSGTGPRDYDPWAADMSIYNPMPGKPGGWQKGVANNLDCTINVGIDPYWPDWPYFGTSFGQYVELSAPMGGNVPDNLALYRYQAVYVATPFPGSWDPITGGPGMHAFWSGTSFSCPLTCGVAALAAEAYYRQHGEMPSPSKLALILKKSADDLVGPAYDDLWLWNNQTLQYEFCENYPCDQPSQDIRYGHGRVNAKNAIKLAQK
jgi:hypothetical protein